MNRAFAIILAAFVLPASAAGAVAVASPDGSAIIRIERDASRFSISRRGETVIASSPLGLEFDGAPGYGPLPLRAAATPRSTAALR